MDTGNLALNHFPFIPLFFVIIFVEFLVTSSINTREWCSCIKWVFLQEKEPGSCCCICFPSHAEKQGMAFRMVLLGQRSLFSLVFQVVCLLGGLLPQIPQVCVWMTFCLGSRGPSFYTFGNWRNPILWTFYWFEAEHFWTSGLCSICSSSCGCGWSLSKLRHCEKKTDACI